MLQRLRKPAHDRQTEPEPAVARPALALEFLEDRFAPIGRNARPRVADVDANEVAPRARPAARRRAGSSAARW